MENSIGIISSAVAAIIAIISLLISIAEMKIRNKQFLFDKRLKAYLIVKWLKQLCDHEKQSAKVEIINSSIPLININFTFSMLTNCGFLEEIQTVIGHVLEEEYHTRYLKKIEEFRNLCEEVKYIFPHDLGYSVSKFLFYYQETLVSMYKYKIKFNYLKEACEKNDDEMPDNNPEEVRLRNIIKNNISNTFEMGDTIWRDGTIKKIEKSLKL